MSETVITWLFGGWLFGGRDRAHERHATHARSEGGTASPGSALHTASAQLGGAQNADLLRRINAGEQQAFAELYNAVFDDLLAFAFRYVHDLAAAEDVVHDVFLSLWSRRATLEVQTTLRAYLFGAVAQSARKAATRTRRNETFVSMHADDGTEVPGPDPADATSLDDRTEAADMHAVVMAALEGLPERQRLAITLRLVNDLTYDEIATVLGVTKGAIAQLIQKAQARLQIALGPYLR